MEEDIENKIMYYKPVDWNVNIIDKNLKMKSSRSANPDFYYDRFLRNHLLQYSGSQLISIDPDICSITTSPPDIIEIAEKRKNSLNSPNSSGLEFSVPTSDVPYLNIKTTYNLVTKTGDKVYDYLEKNYDKDECMERILIPFLKKEKKIDTYDQEFLCTLIEWWRKNILDTNITNTTCRILHSKAKEPSSFLYTFSNLSGAEELSLEETLYLANLTLSLANPFVTFINKGLPIYNSDDKDLGIVIQTAPLKREANLTLEIKNHLYSKENFSSIKTYISYLKKLQLPTMNYIKNILLARSNREITNEEINELLDSYISLSKVLCKRVEIEKAKHISIEELKMYMEILYEKIYREKLYSNEELTDYSDVLGSYQDISYKTFKEMYKNTSTIKKEKRKVKKN